MLLVYYPALNSRYFNGMVKNLIIKMILYLPQKVNDANSNKQPKLIHMAVKVGSNFT